MSTSATTGAMFTGVSRYSSDFQASITRAVSIASLPISQLNHDVTALQSQSTALSSLDTKFAALAAAVAAVDTAAGAGSLEATISGAAVVSASVTTGAMEGIYSIEVGSIGSYTTTISSGTPAVTDPSTENISSATAFTLTVGSGSYLIEPAGDSLYDLANAINDTLEANVRATVVNVGSSSSPDYRLSLQSTKLGVIAIQLSDGGNLLTEQASGTLASYKVNGVVPAATSDSRSVTIAPGLTLSLLAQSTPGDATTITLTQSSSALSTALSNLATAYNNAVDELDKHRGLSTDALSGQSVIYSASSALRAFSTYTSESGGGSLSDLGITFELTGHMTYNALTFMGAAFSDMSSITQFLGSASSGGLLQATTDAMNSLEDPTSGAIKGAIQSVSESITSSNNRIADEQTRVDRLQQQLLEQMAAADAVIAAMEQQYSYISQMLEAMQVNQGNMG